MEKEVGQEMNRGANPLVIASAQSAIAEPFSYLKQVSRVKHEILGRYLSAWSGILGTKFRHLGYFDCFAGDGRYVDERGQQLPGSPQHALRMASDFVSKSPGRSLILGFIERDEGKSARLIDTLQNIERPKAVMVKVFAADARDLSDQMIAAVRSQSLTIPPFFFVDPYGYPLPVPMLRRLLTLPKAEVLVNLMWYRINMDLGKTLAWDRIDALFGHNDWILQNFDEMSGSARERTFIDYFQKEVGAPFHVPSDDL